MNTYKHQSKKPKPQSASERVERFKKDLEALGYHVTVDYRTSRYAPTVTLEVWTKDDRKSA